MIARLTLPVLAIVAAPSAAAQEERQPASITALTRCRDLSAPMERLACYDKAVDQVGTALRSGALLALDRKAVMASKQERFGLPRTTPTDRFGGGSADIRTAVTQIDSTIRSAKAAARLGRIDLALTDGSLWQTIDALAFPPRPGTPVSVKQAALGGYRATIDGGRAILVKRLR
ncbi:hypothetical protein [Sphingomonas carotinifaciens]|uniref:hypothetical protein n=1 Tax=Sphingomonas carotinifaciens TaxID=1166323 RepID=UPI000DD566B9|nr:hypothetical protein [Sphingomonas carotinifaciens]